MMHLARLTSVLMGLITVALVIVIGWHIFGEYPWIGLLAGALTAFMPQFLFVSGVINNDNLLTMAVTGVWWQTLRAVKAPRRWQNWTYVGIWLAVALLAKSSATCFPSSGPIMIFLSLGIAGWLPKRLTALPVTALILVLVGVAIYMPLRVIAPAYQTVTLAKPSLWLVSDKTDLAFGSAFKLRGYEIQPSRDGSTLTLKLYWQAAGKSDFDYSAFAHLIDESGQIVAQKDHAPGESLDYPPTSWNSEDIVVDEHILQIPPNYVLGYTVCGSGCTTGRPASSCRSQHRAIRSGISQFWIGRTRGTEAVFAAEKGGTLEGAALHQRSDRDGDLGTGSRTLATLSPGRHVIMPVATDKDGNQATASITLYAGGKTYLPLVVCNL